MNKEPNNSIQRVNLNNNDYCVVKNCRSSAKKNPNLSFHRFPKKEKRDVFIKNSFGVLEKVDLQKAWLIALKASKIDKRMTVCSLHFKETDYYLPGVPTKARRLKLDAVPSCNLPKNNSKAEHYHKVRKERLQNRNLKKEEASRKKRNQKVKRSNFSSDVDNESEMPSESFDFEEDSEILNINTVPDIIDQQQQATCSMLLHKAQESGPYLQQNCLTQSNQDFSAQTDLFNLSSFIKTDEQLSTVTGIESFKLLDVIVEIVKKNSKEKFESNNCNLKTRDRIILTYAKLKLNTSFAFLALMFRCCPTTCSRIFQATIQILSKCLKFAIAWPSKEEIIRNLPECFKDFENTRVVLDCTEIFIQQPKNVCCQIVTYSQYKSHLTGKIMTGVTPAGNISFISDFYGGRCSDNAIFEQSNLINLLEPNDAVMVDRGFLIDKQCEENRLKLIRPPYLKDREKFTQEESVLNAKIASARVHVERSNQRIKNFSISRYMSSNLVPLINEIFIVICATVNLSAPIISDSKFMNSTNDVTFTDITESFVNSSKN